jgi:SSS family solute:Na+ symporter
MLNIDGLLFAQASNALGIWDWGTLIAYFVVLLGIAWWVILQKTDSSKEYFLAGRHAGWFVIVAIYIYFTG